MKIIKDERFGKAANREYEEKFVGNVKEFPGAQVGGTIVDGDHAAVEWTFDLTFKDGNRVKMQQVPVQTWKKCQCERLGPWVKCLLVSLTKGFGNPHGQKEKIIWLKA
ncbi:MAG: hypothetical protein NPIRA06_15690 [Nitrospirales bacterium]|nr:MAG: hypothetical protein NPIRA06_15690 [Nitrospirales bacterium]